MIRLKSRREVVVPNGIVVIVRGPVTHRGRQVWWQDGKGFVELGANGKPLTEAERRELADLMVAAWQAWAVHPAGPRKAG